ncbi:MAG: hypothetical protein WED07_02275 [Candidatus Freyarchaeum deiterrae]
MELEKKGAKKSKSSGKEVSKATGKTISRVSVKEKVSRAEGVELDDLRVKNQDQPLRFNDWYFTMHFSHEGKERLAKFSITEGTLLGQFDSFNYATGPLSLEKDNDIQVLKKPSDTIDMAIPPSSKDAFKYREDDEGAVIEMDDLTVFCSKEEQKVISKNEKLGCELTFKPRGPPLFWGGARNATSRITEGTEVDGLEDLSDVQGKIIVDGEELEVEGKGLFEHVWFNKLDFFAIRQVDWIYLNFDQMYTFFCPVESVLSDGRPNHHVTGTVYMISEDDYLSAKEIEVVPDTWVFVEECHRFIPTQYKVKVETDKGVLNMNAALALYPQFIQKVKLDNLRMQGIYAWNVNFYDAPITLTGEFVYKDGKTVKLTNGRGMNETIRIAPL